MKHAAFGGFTLVSGALGLRVWDYRALLCSG